MLVINVIDVLTAAIVVLVIDIMVVACVVATCPPVSRASIWLWGLLPRVSEIWWKIDGQSESTPSGRHGSCDNLTSKMPNKTSIKTSKSIVIWHICVFLRTQNQTYLEVGFRGFPMYRRRVLVVLLATFRCEHLGTWSASLRTLTPGQLGKQLVTYWSMSIDCCILVTSPVSARSRLTPHIERRKKEGALLASKRSAWLSLAHECEWHRLPPPVR